MTKTSPAAAALLSAFVIASCGSGERVVRDEARVDVRVTGGDTASASTVEVREMPDPSQVRELAVGDDGRRCALLDDASVWCWSEQDRDRTPERVEGLDETAHLFGGSSAFCAVNEGGRVLCWGDLGIERGRWREPRLLAIPPPTAMAFGENGGCAIAADETVRCWGAVWNGHGAPHSSVEAVSGLAGVTALEAYGLSRCAITRASELVCWGWERFHHLGPRRDDGRFVHRETRDAVDVALSRENVWWVTRDGHVRGMIRGAEDRRRSGTYRFDAVDLRGIEDAIALESTGSTLCAITRAGALWCFDPISREATVQSITGVRALVSTERSGVICARTDGGWFCRDRDEDWTALAWGPREARATGAPAVPSGPVCGYGPDRVPVEALAAGYGHFCARLGDGRVRCWGMNHDGQVGGAMSGDPVSSRASGVPRPATAIATGLHFSCAITDDGGMWCWGQGDHGQLGRGGRRNSGDAMQVGMRDRVAAMALGRAHACARTERGQVWCWGANDSGQLGDGTSELRTTPVRVPTLRAASVIAAGPDASCAVDRGHVMCWGGASGAAPPHAIEGVDGSAVRELVVARGAACALLEDGAVWCWGSGAEGQLGPAERVESARAVRIEGIPAARTIAAYETELCVATRDGGAWCWGRAPRRGSPYAARRREREPPPGTPRRIAWIDSVIAIAPGCHAACAAQQTGGVCCWEGEPMPVPMTW